jgi:hypothetical protein
MLAHTRLLDPNTFPSRREAAISNPNDVKPEMKTVMRMYNEEGLDDLFMAG